MLSQRGNASGTSPTAEAVTFSPNIKALYHVIGDADAGLLPRVAEPAAKLGLVPSRLHASCEAGDGSLMTIDLRLGEVSQTVADRIERSLRAIVGVHQVIAVYEH